jgi:hypothetical protein
VLWGLRPTTHAHECSARRSNHPTDLPRDGRQWDELMGTSAVFAGVGLCLLNATADSRAHNGNPAESVTSGEKSASRSARTDGPVVGLMSQSSTESGHDRGIYHVE